jgi:MYXO-CTERM domain-containing protein
MRWTLPGLCLLTVVLASPAAGQTTTDVTITSGQTSRPVSSTNGAFLTLFGDDFTLTAALLSGAFAPPPPYLPGSIMTVRAGWSGLDAPGSFTYLGQTFTFGGFNGPGLTVNFLSDPFTVPTFNGTNPSEIPFTLEGAISGFANGDRYNLHGAGTMTFTFTGPTGTPTTAWMGGNAQFTLQPEPTPEPSPFIVLLAALGGLAFYARRRRSGAGAVR